MGDFVHAYSKFLIGNINFFYYIIDELLGREKINSNLILKVQRRIKVLKLIGSVSDGLKNYFFGNDYEEGVCCDFPSVLPLSLSFGCILFAFSEV